MKTVLRSDELKLPDTEIEKLIKEVDVNKDN
jgi:Ca2+-binding EF-hand superfamily protein